MERCRVFLDSRNLAQIERLQRDNLRWCYRACLHAPTRLAGVKCWCLRSDVQHACQKHRPQPSHVTCGSTPLDVVDLHLRYSLIPPHFSPHTQTGAMSLASHLRHSFNYKSSNYRVIARELARSPVYMIQGHCKHAKTRYTQDNISRTMCLYLDTDARREPRGYRKKSMGHVEPSYDAWSGPRNRPCGC